jgi:putative DNA primase/helicase
VDVTEKHDRGVVDVFADLEASLFASTDLGNAERFVDQHGTHVRHNRALGWLAWDGCRWRTDAASEVWQRAALTVRTIGDAKWAARSEAWNRQRAMLELVQHQPSILVQVEQLDARPWLFNVANGVLDLEAGTLRAHDPADLLTKRSPVVYDPEAKSPKWDAFLEEVVPSSDVREFLQRAVGYSLTGLSIEQVLFLLYGVGANGKTTFLEVVRAIAGDYGQQTPAATLLSRRSDGIPNDVARLRGARFVSAVETEANRTLAESLVKRLTGGDKIAARFLFKEFFEFDTEFSLWLATNHRPRVRGTDHAIWRRILLVPFTTVIPDDEQDKHLTDTLIATELPGILAWAVRGCVAWRTQALDPPKEVIGATTEYRAEQDILGDFIAEMCDEVADHVESAKNLYDAYRRWCDGNGERPETQKQFGMALAERGFERPRTSSARQYKGLKIREQQNTATW